MPDDNNEVISYNKIKLFSALLVLLIAKNYAEKKEMSPEGSRQDLLEKVAIGGLLTFICSAVFLNVAQAGVSKSKEDFTDSKVGELLDAMEGIVALHKNNMAAANVFEITPYPEKLAMANNITTGHLNALLSEYQTASDRAKNDPIPSLRALAKVYDLQADIVSLAIENNDGARDTIFSFVEKFSTAAGYEEASIIKELRKFVDDRPVPIPLTETRLVPYRAGEHSVT